MKYHILNGDALKMQLSASLEGTILICRECLIDGSIVADDIDSFFQMRACFLEGAYGVTQEEYRKGKLDFDRMLEIPESSEVYLWFEEDLFCQLNLWFVASLLASKKLKAYLVLPDQTSPYSFGQMSLYNLLEAKSKAKKLDDDQLSNWARMWRTYQQKDFELLFAEAKKQFGIWPFLLQAVQSAKELYEGEVLRGFGQIIQNSETPNFGKIFQQFSEKFSYLGLGDLQVKRMYDELLKKVE